MAIYERFVQIFVFRTRPTSLVALLLYLAVFVCVLWGDSLPEVPKFNNQHGLDLNWAYRDLQAITVFPHPYNSRANDVVRHHILSRVQAIASSHSHVHVDNDLYSNVTFVQKYGVYFEGTNILAKIDGTAKRDRSAGGVLLSAHYDSVSTAHGATDDGMGIVTLLQLLDYFARHRPEKTLIFNFNNGEEDFLNGAHVFLEHPWSNLVDTFLNLEGAGAGGRPILFRTTSAALTRAFAHVPHPHATSLTADAFKHGFIRSDTDYSVYIGPGSNKQGLDLAFYEHRSKYHTMDDSIPNLSGKKALWNMMETALYASSSLTKAGADTLSRTTSVYFDLFGETMGIFSITTFFIWNVIMLVVGPILVGSLLFLAQRDRKLYWTKKGWGRFPLGFAFGLILAIILSILYTSINPNTIYSRPWLVFASGFFLSYVGLCLPISALDHYRTVPQQKTIITTQLYVLWWIILVFGTVLVRNFDISGFYFVTFFHASTLASLLFGFGEHFTLPPAWKRRLRIRDNGRFSRSGEQEREESGSVQAEEEEPVEATEHTPLVRQTTEPHHSPEDEKEENKLIHWVFQLVLAIPFPVILILQIGVVMMKSLPQTLADGNHPFIVYLVLNLIAFLAVLPTAPFLHKFSRSLFYSAFMLCLVTTLYGVLAFPFSSNNTLKVFFQQEIDLDSGVNHVTLTGLPEYVKDHIIPELPSAFAKDIVCDADPLKPGLHACSWIDGLPPAVSSAPYDEWLTLNATLLAPGSALLTITPSSSRNCRLYFDSPVRNVRVRGSSGAIQEGYPLLEEGLSELRLWSRSWDRTFEVEVGWDGSAGMSGRGACEWAESKGGAIPALDEVAAFSPTWVMVSKRTDGLLEGWKSFSI